MEDACARPLYLDFDGYRLSAAFNSTLLKSALDYVPTPEDVFVVTFPKCGTTWVQHIAYLIFNGGERPRNGLDFLKNSPFIEMLGADAVRAMKRPGIIKSHLPFSMVPYSNEAKYIYVSRNPKDCCASFFYHTKSFSGYEFTNGTFEVFFDLFCKGETDFGSYFDHLLSWYEHRDDSNVLFMHYEDMKSDPLRHILKIANFLGEKYQKKMLEDPVYLEKVLKDSDVSAMKEYTNRGIADFFCRPLSTAGEEVPEGLKRWHRVSQDVPSDAQLVRKGVVGDYRNVFTPEMNDTLDQIILDKFQGTEFLDVWRKYGVFRGCQPVLT